MKMNMLMIMLPLFLLVWSPKGPARPQNLPQRDTQHHAISKEIDLVVLPVTVTDSKGQVVSGLAEGNFQVFDDGQAQTIAQFSHDDVSLTVGLVVDDSGSMRQNRSEVATASTAFLRSSNPQDQIFVVNFNEVASLGLPPDLPFTTDIGQLEEAVRRGPISGQTALYDAVHLGMVHLESGTRDKKALVIISDGGDNASQHTFSQIQAMALHDNVLIYAIGIISDLASDINPQLLRKLAKNTGGKAYFPTSAADLPGICQEIARDLREQYTLAYDPSNGQEPGKYHQIRVAVNARGRGKLTARTRTGYFTPGPGANGQE
jgi:VWFA-related protein